MMTRFKFDSLLTALLTVAVLGQSRPAHAITILKQVQVSNGSEIALLFDGKLNKNQIRTEFFNDIIQVNLSDVSVYPAKISSVGGAALTKVFAYQYAPKLVRCRLSVKGKAEDFKNKLLVTTSGKMLTIRIGDGKSDRLTTSAAQARVGEPAKAELKVDEVEERELLDKVMKSNPDSAPAKILDVTRVPLTNAVASAKAQPLAMGKGIPSPAGAFGKLLLVLGIFGLVAYAFKRALSGRAGNSKVFGAINRFAEKSGLGRKGRMIEVVSTHHLGPKKSIAVVRVAGRLLVLGISSDSINLITRISGDESDPLAEFDGPAHAGLGGSGATAAGPAIFSDLLNLEAAKPVPTPKPSAPSVPPAQTTIGANQGYGSHLAGASVRAQIRSRLEGLKPL